MKKFILFMVLLLGVSAFGIQVENHADDVITYFVMRDQTAGTVDTGVTIANLEMYYVEDQAAISGDAFVGAHGAVTDAHTDGECIHIGYGVYRVDWPDGAFDGGVGKRVQLILIDGDAGAFTEILEVELSPPSNVTQLDGSDIQQGTGHIHAYDDAGAALCPSGEPLTAQETEDEAIDALESFKLDELNAEAVTTSLATAVNDNSILGYMLAKANVSNYSRTDDSGEGRTDYGDTNWLTAVNVNITQVGGDAIQDNNDGRLEVNVEEWSDSAVGTDPLTAAEVEAEAVDALESFNLDHVAKLAVDTNLQTTVHDNSVLGYILASANVSAYVRTTDSLEDLGENIADIETDTSAFDTAAEWLGLLAAVDTDATSATHATTYVTLEAGKASNDAYNGMLISVTDAGDSNVETRRIEDYTSGRKVTFDRALSFTPVQNDIIRIYGAAYDQLVAVAGGTANTYIVTDTGAVGGTGIADVAVWLTIDSAGARLVTSGITDDDGEVVFYLDSGITYYVWMSKSGYSFSDNGEAWVAD